MTSWELIKVLQPIKLNQLTENKQSNFIQIKIKAIKQLRKSLKRRQRLTTFYRILRESRIMIISDTLLLKMVVGEEVVLETLTFLIIFQIFLRIFLEKVLAAEEGQEDQITEVLT